MGFTATAVRPAELRTPKRKPRSTKGVAPPYKTMYAAYLSDMRDRWPELVLTRRGPPVSFSVWGRGAAPEEPCGVDRP